MPKFEFKYTPPAGWVSAPNVRIIPSTNTIPVDCINHIKIDLSNVKFQSQPTVATPSTAAVAQQSVAANDQSVSDKGGFKIPSAIHRKKRKSPRHSSSKNPHRPQLSSPDDSTNGEEQDVTIIDDEHVSLHEPAEKLDSGYTSDTPRLHKKKRRAIELSEDEEEGAQPGPSTTREAAPPSPHPAAPPVPTGETFSIPQQSQRSPSKQNESPTRANPPQAAQRPDIIRVKQDPEASGSMSPLGQQPASILLGSPTSSIVPDSLSFETHASPQNMPVERARAQPPSHSRSPTFQTYPARPQHPGTGAQGWIRNVGASSVPRTRSSTPQRHQQHTQRSWQKQPQQQQQQLPQPPPTPSSTTPLADSAPPLRRPDDQAQQASHSTDISMSVSEGPVVPSSHARGEHAEESVSEAASLRDTSTTTDLQHQSQRTQLMFEELQRKEQDKSQMMEAKYENEQQRWKSQRDDVHFALQRFRDQNKNLQEEETRKKEKQKEDEERRRERDHRVNLEAARKRESVQRAEAHQKQIDVERAQRRAVEEAQRRAQQLKMQQEEKRKAEMEKHRQEKEKAEQDRKALEEAKLKAQQQKAKQEAERRAAEEERQNAEEAYHRELEAELRAQQDAQRKAEEEKKREQHLREQHQRQLEAVQHERQRALEEQQLAQQQAAQRKADEESRRDFLIKQQMQQENQHYQLQHPYAATYHYPIQPVTQPRPPEQNPYIQNTSRPHTVSPSVGRPMLGKPGFYSPFTQHNSMPLLDDSDQPASYVPSTQQGYDPRTKRTTLNPTPNVARPPLRPGEMPKFIQTSSSIYGSDTGEGSSNLSPSTGVTSMRDGSESPPPPTVYDKSKLANPNQDPCPPKRRILCKDKELDKMYRRYENRVVELSELSNDGGRFLVLDDMVIGDLPVQKGAVACLMGAYLLLLMRFKSSYKLHKIYPLKDISEWKLLYHERKQHALVFKLKPDSLSYEHTNIVRGRNVFDMGDIRRSFCYLLLDDRVASRVAVRTFFEFIRSAALHFQAVLANYTQEDLARDKHWES